MRLAHNIIATSPETRRQLSEWMGTLRGHRLDQKLYPIGRAAVSILLRLAQFLLIAPNRHAERNSELLAHTTGRVGRDRGC